MGFDFFKVSRFPFQQLWDVVKVRLFQFYVKETETERAKPKRYLTSNFILKSSYSNIFGDVAIKFKSKTQSTHFHIIMVKNQFHWFYAGCWAVRAPDSHVGGSVGTVQESPTTCRLFWGYACIVKMSHSFHWDLAPHSLHWVCDS